MVPFKQWNVVSNGNLIKSEELKEDKLKFMDGQDTYWLHQFEEFTRVPTYIINLSVGDFYVYTSNIEN